MGLFFGPEGDGRGWLQRRYESAPSPHEFAAAMRSPELLAAVLAWVLGISHEGRTPAHARFELTAALSVARLPWLWDGLDDELTCRELGELLVRTAPSVSDNSTFDDEKVRDLWLRLLQRGHAFRRLERAIAGRYPAELGPLIEQKQLGKGELLWQEISGFCVVAEPALRAPETRVVALTLRWRRGSGGFSIHGQVEGSRDLTRFFGDCTVPIAALLEPSVVPVTETFGERPREVLRAFLGELAEGFARGPSDGN